MYAPIFWVNLANSWHPRVLLYIFAIVANTVALNLIIETNSTVCHSVCGPCKSPQFGISDGVVVSWFQRYAVVLYLHQRLFSR